MLVPQGAQSIAQLEQFSVLAQVLSPQPLTMGGFVPPSEGVPPDPPPALESEPPSLPADPLVPPLPGESPPKPLLPAAPEPVPPSIPPAPLVPPRPPSPPLAP